MYGGKNIKSGVSKELARPLYTATHYFALIYTDITLLAVYIRSLFSVTAVQLCDSPAYGRLR